MTYTVDITILGRSFHRPGTDSEETMTIERGYPTIDVALARHDEVAVTETTARHEVIDEETGKVIHRHYSVADKGERFVLTARPQSRRDYAGETAIRRYAVAV